jgi:hypothetical protein
MCNKDYSETCGYIESLSIGEIDRIMVLFSLEFPDLHGEYR